MSVNNDFNDIQINSFPINVLDVTDLTKTNKSIIAFSQMRDQDLFWVVVNNSNVNSSGWVSIDKKDISRNSYYLLHDMVGKTLYIRSGEELFEKGLYVYLKGYESHFFRIKEINKSVNSAAILNNILEGQGIPSDIIEHTDSDCLHLFDDEKDDTIIKILHKIDFDYISDKTGKKLFRSEDKCGHFDVIYVNENDITYMVVLNKHRRHVNDFVKSRLFDISENIDAKNKLFFILEDMLTDKIYIRQSNDLKTKGLFISLPENGAHFFKIKKVLDTKYGVISVMYEQANQKGIQKNELFKNILNDKNDVINIEQYIQIHKADPSTKNLSWIETNIRDLIGKKIIYMSMEMLIPEFYETKDNQEYDGAVDANFNGGLGILAGCSMEGFKEIGLDACAIIPMYKERRVQEIGEHLGQAIYDEDVQYDKYKNLEKVFNLNSNEQLEIHINVFGKPRIIKVWKIKRAGIDVFLLECPEIFDEIYTGDRRQRLLQEITLGKSTPLLLKALNIRPDILHLNEAHPVLSAVYIKEWKKINDLINNVGYFGSENNFVYPSDNDNFFENTKILFTVHTPRPAGMEVFYINYDQLEIPLGYEKLFDPKHENKMDFTHAASELADRINTVSDNQIRVVTERILKDNKYKNKIIGILNGTSKSYWMSDRMKKFISIPDDKINNLELWNAHLEDKKDVYQQFEIMMKNQNIANKLSIDSKHFSLDVDKPSAWAIRRIVDYKSQWPLLKDIIRVICADRNTTINTKWGDFKGLQMQIVIGGIAHPNDSASQQWIKEFVMWMKGKWRDEFDKPYIDAKELIGNFFFLPASCDGLGKTLKMFALGCDLCLEIPLWDEEACGTSGMRALSNSNPSIDSSDGALEWIEDGINGFKLEPHSSIKLLELLEIFSEQYYQFISYKENRNFSPEHDPFLNMKKNAFTTWRDKADIAIMSKRYALEMFYPTLASRDIIGINF
jgi:glycogen phosphorylase